MRVRNFIVGSLGAFLIVIATVKVNADAEGMETVQDIIKSHGRIVYDNGTSEDVTDDIIIFDATDIELLSDRLAQIEIRVEQLRNKGE